MVAPNLYIIKIRNLIYV